jgi:cbb3-type cytochrome oxidase subunit 1
MRTHTLPKATLANAQVVAPLQYVAGTQVFAKQHCVKQNVAAYTNAPKAIVAQMHYVLNRAGAGKFTGSKCGSSNITMYAVFATLQQASTFVAKNKMRLYACIVSI